MMDDIKSWAIAKHENLREVWKNSDEKQKDAIMWASLYTSIVTTIWCGVASVIF